MADMVRLRPDQYRLLNYVRLRQQAAYRAGQMEQYWQTEDGPSLGEVVAFLARGWEGRRLRRVRAARWRRVRSMISTNSEALPRSA